MAFLEKIIRIGDVTIVEKYHSSRYGSKGKCVRSQNYGKTPENMAARNLRYAKQRADAVFKANFKKGDLIIVFTFAPENRPKSEKELLRIVDNYLKKCRRAYKKAGIVFKYQKSIGSPDKNPHIHAAFSAIDLALLPEWKYGGVHITPVDGRENHTFGGYLISQPEKHKRKNAPETEELPMSHYSHSRNCIVPQPEIRVISSDHWSEEPRAPKGYYIIKDSLQNWEDEVNGYKHQSYIMCKLPEKKPKPKQQAARRRC